MAPGAGRRIDVHLHLSRYWPDPPETFYRRDLDFSVRGLLAEMDAQGIEQGLLLPEEHTPTIEETLREGSEALRASGGRLRQVGTADPTRGPEEIAHAIELWERTPDLVALKFYPGYRQFYPHDPRLFPVYEFAHRRGLVVMFHQGDTLDPLGLLKFARPIELDEVAVRFRDVRFVLCHFGNPWIDEAAEVVYKNENVYADTSGLVWSPRVPYYDRMVEQASLRIGNAIRSMGHAERVLYGSDWPLVALDVAVRIVSKLDIEPADKERIFGGNARALYRLDRPSGGPPA